MPWDTVATAAPALAGSNLLDKMQLPGWTGKFGKGVSRVAPGLGALGLLAMAAGEFSDKNDTVGGNAIDATGAAVGGGLSGVAGAAAAGMMGAGPVGALVLGSLAAALGGQVGKGALRGATNALFPGKSPEDKALEDTIKARQADLGLRVDSAHALMPIQAQLQKQATADALVRLAAERDAQMSMNYQNALLRTIGQQSLNTDANTAALLSQAMS